MIHVHTNLEGLVSKIFEEYSEKKFYKVLKKQYHVLRNRSGDELVCLDDYSEFYLQTTENPYFNSDKNEEEFLDDYYAPERWEEIKEIPIEQEIASLEEIIKFRDKNDLMTQEIQKKIDMLKASNDKTISRTIIKYKNNNEI